MRGALHICGCGRRFALADWLRLELCGVQDPDDEDAAELRNCDRCWSTRAVLISTLPPPPAHPHSQEAAR